MKPGTLEEKRGHPRIQRTVPIRKKYIRLHTVLSNRARPLAFTLKVRLIIKYLMTHLARLTCF